MATNFSVSRALTTAFKSTDALSEETFAGFVTFAAGDTLTLARIAFVVSSRGVGSSDGKSSVTRFANESGRTRSLLSQYATQISWLDSTGTPIDADTFAIAKTLYNRGADARKAVKANMAEIAALDSVDSKVKAWNALSDSVKAPTKTDDKSAGTDDSETTGATGRPNDGTSTGERFTAADWINALDSLRATVAVLDGAPVETVAMARDILAELSAVVGASVDA
jgi:hypothetical protein